MTNAIRLGKKTFTWSVVVLTILWSMGVAALVPVVANAQAACPTLEAGDLFKVPGNSAVYLLNGNMQRMYFPHSTVYHTWYTDFSGVVEIPTTCVDAYPAPSSAPFGVNYRPGSKLVKVQISPSVYVIEPGNVLAKVGSEAVAISLYGSNWATKVMDVADVFWPNYATTGAELTEAVPHNGMLVKVAGGSTYEVVGDELMLVDGAVRLASDVQTVSQAVFDSVSMGSGSVTAASLYADPTQGAGGVGTGTGTGSTSSGTLTVALAADTPSGTYGYDGQARTPFTKVNFTATGGDVVISEMKVVRGGVGLDADFSKVNIVDPDGDLLNEQGKTLNSDHLVTFTEDVTIPSGTTKAYTLVGDMAAAVTGGNVPKLGLYSVTTASTVVGSLPLYGNAVSLNSSVVLGTATVAEGSVLSTVTKQIGDTDVDMASLKITVATQDFQVERITLYNSGTADSDDFVNVALNYNNNKVADGVWDGKYVTFDLSSCGDSCKILKSNNKTFTVIGDIVDGSTRTMMLDVKRDTHVLAKELNTNVYVTPTNSATSMDNTVTISQGKLNITKVNNVPAGNVPENSTGVELGSWNFKVSGEAIDISVLAFRITPTAGAAAEDFDALVLYNAAGQALTGSADGVGSTNAAVGWATSTDTISLPVGDNILTLKGNIDSNPTTNDTVTFAIDMDNTTNFEATGVDSGETITLVTYATPGTGVVSANTRTITSAALRVTTLSSPPATTYAGGTNGVTFAQVQLDATGSSEDLKVTQMIVKHISNSTALPIDIQNIRLWVDKDGDSNNGTGTAEELSVVNAGASTTADTDEAETFNLSGVDQFTVKAGKRLVVYVKGDIAGGATAGTHNFGVSTSDYVSAIGLSTNSTVVEAIDTASGNVMTIGSSGGQVQVSLDNSNPDAKLFAGGTSGATLAVFNFLATTTEDVEMERVKFTQVVTATASSSYLDYDLLYLENEAGVTVGSVTPTSTTPVIEFGDDAFVVDKDDVDGQKMYLKANLSNIGTSYNVTVGGHRLGYSISAATDIVGKGLQTGSASNEYLGTTVPTGNTNYFYKATPTITKLAVTNTLGNGDIELYRFKVTANTGDIDLYKFTFDVTTTSVNVTNVELLDVTTDTEVSLYSQAVGASPSNVSYFDVLLDDDNPTAGDGGEARTVAVGTPRTFILRGTVTGAASGDSISTRMGGDSAVADGASANGSLTQMANILMASSTVIDAGIHDDFIWSDRNLSTHSTSTNDWVNGYLVSGLNSASSTATTVSM
ncbi:MAG: hypothetical protein A2469_00165 [Candidatus Magasanikbacteria bacterium RIFOXYC2_FULL_40_16]|uniref:Uncharacterized protein n=2 Tax=Candidatus Magasanikiibacteriota TaxID=1752731 RepID=A0A1F6NJQ1_9BACT|nr:MAG: hypothetical protein A2373_02925 [Candidatus Magasanikbacteria bacterium RIFOXYB1_FULL_40_15]OGH90265.1 MAG: hypothetical protein A2469_00165 [Candidatus Magasanikbacteria bacterium RIFOXYC2_FULL_40_16]